MRVLFRLVVLCIVGAAAFVAWPTYAVLQIRDAMRAGDTATLTRKVDWEGVRASLKASMSAEALAALERDPGTPKPSLWQRVKATIVPQMAATAIDRHVTPENFPVFLGYRRMWRGISQPLAQAPHAPGPLAGTVLAETGIDRFAEFFRRIRRLVVYSPGRFDIEVVDRSRPDRSFTGTIELRGLEWKLTALTVATLPAASGAR